LYRIIDANINRACEGLRVLEDQCRFGLNNPALSAQFREMRHDLRKGLAVLDSRVLAARNSRSDVGLTVSQASDSSAKSSTKQIVTANFKRVQEALRSIEENLNIVEPALSKIVERLRFAAYSLEKDLQTAFMSELPAGLYGLTGKKFAKGRSNSFVVKAMLEGGIKVIQYREKYPETQLKTMYAECKELRKICSDYGAMFIINDFVDLALMCEADGIHLGQDDWPLGEVRKIVGNKIIGLSTHSPD